MLKALLTRLILFWPLLLLAIVFSVFFSVVGTEAGTKFALTLALRQLPGAAKVETIQGRLWHSATLSNLHYQQNGWVIDLKKLQWQRNNNQVTITLKGKANNHALKANAVATVSLPMHITVQGKVSLLDNIFKLTANYQQGWQGSLTGRLHNLSQLDPALAGQADIDAKFQKQRFDLKAKFQTLKAGDFYLPKLSATVHAQNNHLTGKLTSMGGALNLKGTRKDKQTQLSLRGQNFTLSTAKDFALVVSPNITLKHSNRLTSLTGELLLPRATIEVSSFSQTNKVSKDIVFTHQVHHTTPKTPGNWAMNLKVKLGKAVNVALQGLTGRLVGELQLKAEPKKGTTANGQISVEDGKYLAYGQQLKIERGLLIYAGGYIDNPGISIRATRPIQAPEVNYVGVNITGTLNTPKIQLFSDPANLSQSQQLAYLLFGYSIQQTNESDHQSLLSAASSMNLNHVAGQQISGQLKHQLGLDVLDLGTDTFSGNPEDAETPGSTVGVGRWLSPKLFMQYSVGLVSHLNTLKVRYLLSKKLSIQAENSEDSNGIDLLYSIEAD